MAAAPAKKQEAGALRVLLFVAILAAIVLAGLFLDANDAWFVILVLMTFFVVYAGYVITGQWRGFLIDQRNKMSLSRLQMVAWTLVVLSALLTAALVNIRLDVSDPVAIGVPAELWIVMGISTTSLLGSPLILGTKRNKKGDATQFRQTKQALQARGQKVKTRPDGLVVENTSPQSARWGDLFRGEESGNAAHLDLGKIQMFYFTFVLLIAYCVALAGELATTRAITALPKIHEGMATLLAISHAGYLGNKAIPHSKES